MPIRKTVAVKQNDVRSTFKKVKPNVLKPIWNLYEHGLTQGAISTFLDCRHQFWLKYVMGYRNKAKGGATAFGSAFHDILAHTQHAEPGKQPKSLDVAVTDYMKSLGTLTPNVQEETSCMLAQIKAIIQLYNKRWEEDHATRTWLKREDTFRFNYELNLEFNDRSKHDFGVSGTSKLIPLRGRWDGVFKKGGSVVLHETKTKGRIDEEGIAKSLPFDTQTMLYCLAILRTMKVCPRGTCYDVIRSIQLRQKQNESTLDFVDRCRADIESRPDWYFMRFDVTITEKELREWEHRFLCPVLCEITRWYESIKADPLNPWKSHLHYMRPGAFWSMYGRSDMFEMLTSGNDFTLERREEPFPELVDA